MDEKRLGAVGSGHEEMRRLAGTLAPPALPQRLKRISSGQFSREMGKVSVRHYRYFFTISQQKPGKRYFREKKDFEPRMDTVCKPDSEHQ